MNNQSNNYILIFVVSGILLLCIICAGIAYFVNEFMPELRRLNIEIKRSEGSERRFYKKQRRRLWLSVLPFVKY